jgi:AcrR family transcriptional regulator
MTRCRTQKRAPLTRDRVLRAALELADEGGTAALTMQRIGRRLGVEAMSLYRHVRNKDDILEGIVDLVFAEMEPPASDSGGDWRLQVVRRAHATRRVLGRHPWAIGLLESRDSPGPATLKHREETIGILRRAGFSVEITAHAHAVLDSFIYGFALQEVSRPFRTTVTELTASRPEARLDPDNYPHLVEMAEMYTLRADYDFGDEFQRGLNLILDGVDRSADSADSATG